MNSGWAVVVSTKRMGGGVPLRELYFAHIAGQEEAENKIRQLCTADQEVIAVQGLGAQVFQALDIPEGAARVFTGE